MSSRSFCLVAVLEGGTRSAGEQGGRRARLAAATAGERVTDFKGGAVNNVPGISFSPLAWPVSVHVSVYLDAWGR